MGAMKMIRMAAVVLALLSGMYAVLGYAMLIRDKGGYVTAHHSLWLLITGVLAVYGAIQVVAVLSQTQGRLAGSRFCAGCGRQAQEDWNLCPACGTRLPEPTREIAPRRLDGDWTEEGEEPEDIVPTTPVVGKVLFWLGIVALDVLFVLLALWLFNPHVVLAQWVFLFVGAAGVGSIVVGYLVTSSPIRL